MEAAPHPNQSERLQTLYDYGVLDTEREKDFDDIVNLAARLCDAPISVINLIDAHRQWFKAEVGLGTRETPIQTSICAHVILSEKFVEIPDTLSDPRLSGNPLCLADPGLRFYAGALLIAENGLPLGTLCVLDNRPRELTELQRDTIKVLAGQVMKLLDLRRALKVQTMLRQEVDHRVKNSLLTVAALTRMQARVASEPQTKRALEAVHGRIETVAALHQALSKSESGDRIDLASYIEGVVRLIDGHRPQNVVVDVDCGEGVTVTSGRASNIGAVVNEFVTNSFKHGFPDGQPGRVSVVCSRDDDDGMMSLICRDNGAGLDDAAVADSASQSLGLKIIQASAAALDGLVEVLPLDQGYGISLQFPIDERPQDPATEAMSA